MTPTAQLGGRNLSEPPQGGFYLPCTGERAIGMGFLIVFLGGGIGAALRHGVNLLMARFVTTPFPFATLFENVTGSLVMGLLAGYFAF